jgi:hypothetical protein
MVFQCILTNEIPDLNNIYFDDEVADSSVSPVELHLMPVQQIYSGESETSTPWNHEILSLQI